MEYRCLGELQTPTQTEERSGMFPYKRLDSIWRRALAQHSSVCLGPTKSASVNPQSRTPVDHNAVGFRNTVLQEEYLAQTFIFRDFPKQKVLAGVISNPGFTSNLLFSSVYSLHHIQYIIMTDMDVDCNSLAEANIRKVVILLVK